MKGKNIVDNLKEALQSNKTEGVGLLNYKDLEIARWFWVISA
jgi:hypothetical protein